MPTYGYRCPSCGHDFDKFQKMSDPSGAVCPECGAAAVRLISGGAGLVFKGSGFYETDYKRAAEKTPAKDGAKGDAAGDAKKKEPKKDTADSAKASSGSDTKSKGTDS